MTRRWIRSWARINAVVGAGFALPRFSMDVAASAQHADFVELISQHLNVMKEAAKTKRGGRTARGNQGT